MMTSSSKKIGKMDKNESASNLAKIIFNSIEELSHSKQK